MAIIFSSLSLVKLFTASEFIGHQTKYVPQMSFKAKIYALPFR